MPCPDKETLHDLIDGELPKEKISDVTEHIKSCRGCKTEVLQMLRLCKVLGEVVAEEACPSMDTLDSYAQNSLSQNEVEKIKVHLEGCSRCESYVWLFKASQAELQEWGVKEKLQFQKFESERIGQEVAKFTLAKLLPDRGDLFVKVWESVMTLVEDLKDKAAAGWPAFGSPAELAGALGFSGTPDPESISAAIIASTSLATAYELVEGKLQAKPEEIAVNVRQTAIRLGAGKELQNRLSETIPRLIIKSL